MKVFFAIGTGRCGTNFLHTLLSLENDVVSHHERHPLNDTFHRYCKWYGLPVDHAGFLAEKRKGIEDDLKLKKISFESSAYLSLSVSEIHQEFGAKFILLVRSPELVINSYIKKGWYENPVNISNPHLIPSYQGNREFHHFLGRTLPKGAELMRWRELTQVGKLAWFWNVLNREVIGSFQDLPPSNVLIVRLEDLDYNKYISDIAPFIGFNPTVSREVFETLSKEKPNAFRNVKSTADWNERERSEFVNELQQIAGAFNYQPEKILAQNAPGTMTGLDGPKERSPVKSFRTLIDTFFNGSKQ